METFLRLYARLCGLNPFEVLEAVRDAHRFSGDAMTFTADDLESDFKKRHDLAASLEMAKERA